MNVLEGFNILNIQCRYLRGSTVRGCVYTLRSAFSGVKNITGNITKSNFKGNIVRVVGVNCYNEVLAYDWESDGSIGALPIRKGINFTSNNICIGTLHNVPMHIANNGYKSLLDPSLTIPLIYGILLVVVVGILAVIIIIMVFIAYIRQHGKH